MKKKLRQNNLRRNNYRHRIGLTMVDILNMKDDIVKVLFYLNFILLLIAFFVSSKFYFISVIVINVILNGTFLVIKNQSHIFEAKMGKFGNSFSKLDRTLEALNNMGNKSGKV